MKTTAEMIQVMQAFENGKTIHYFNKNFPENGWLRSPCPTWNWLSYDYKVFRQELKLDWDAIHHMWKYAAVDANGNVCLYTHIPKFLGRVWGCSAQNGSRVTMHIERLLSSVVIPKGLEAIESLIERPAK